MQINQVITRKIVNVKLFQGKCTPPGNAKLFQMGFLGSERKEYQTGLKLAIFGTKWLQISKPKSPESLDISTIFEASNKQGTQQPTEFILSFVESLGVMYRHTLKK